MICSISNTQYYAYIEKKSDFLSELTPRANYWTTEVCPVAKIDAGIAPKSHSLHIKRPKNLNIQSPHLPRPLFGIMYILLATFLFASHDGISKYLTAFYAPVLVVWARFMTQSILMLGIFGPRMGLDIIRTKQIKLQLARGICMMIASLCFVMGLRYVPVGEATAVVFLSPIVVTWYAGRVLKEKINVGQWIAVFVGLLGVLIIVRPGSSLFTPAIMFPMGTSISMAIFQVLTRQLLLSDHIVSTNFFTSMICTVMMSTFVTFFWQTPTIADFFLALIGGTLAMIGHLLLTYAYRYASIVTLAPFSYAQIVFASLVSLMYFGHSSDTMTLIGMGVIILSGVCLIWWQRK